jgi:hypothetical protein
MHLIAVFRVYFGIAAEIAPAGKVLQDCALMHATQPQQLGMVPAMCGVEKSAAQLERIRNWPRRFPKLLSE